MFNTKMPATLMVRDCVLVRGTDKGYIECLNEDNYVTVFYIVRINAEIVPQNQCCQVPIVEGTELYCTSAQYLHCSESTHHESEEKEAGRGEGW